MIAQADRQTIQNRPVKSIDLMEEASRALFDSIMDLEESIYVEKWLVLCGKGNNAGDGLALARILASYKEVVDVALVFPESEMTAETALNLERLKACDNSTDTLNIFYPEAVSEESFLEKYSSQADSLVVVDALLGHGVRGPVREPLLSLIRRLNASGLRVWSLDLPSGMPTEPAVDFIPETVKAERTFSIALPKLSMMFPESGAAAGRLHLVPLHLDENYIASSDSPYIWIDEYDIRRIISAHGRNEFAHKGQQGHALLVCGSVGMTGAAVLSAGAALRSGCGLLTVHLPESERAVMHMAHPSAIVSPDPAPHFSVLPQASGKYTAVGVGCGLGTHEDSADALHRLMQWGKPMVLDADALNILSSHQEWLDSVPAGSVLTPHLGELCRLVGDWHNPSERMALALGLARRTRSCVVVKGAHTMTVTPDGQYLFNGNGNPGMAKGGSGDVLTGLMTGLLARGFSAVEAAVCAVWYHGMAGDSAAAAFGEDSMNSEDICSLIRVL